MAGIETYLEQIKNAIYGRDVRQAIHDGIHQCYEDGKAGAIDLVARQEIAELIAPSGEAPSAAEITDARIGANAVTYTSLKQRIDTEVTDLKNDLDHTREPVGINLFNPTTVKEKTSLNSTTGAETSATVYSVSDFIEVNGTYFVKPFEWNGSASRIWIYRYDSSKTFTVRNVVNPADYPNGHIISHTGYIRIMLDNGVNTNAYENPWKYMVAKSNNWTNEFVSYYTEIDSVARENSLSNRSASGITDADDITTIGYHYLSANSVANLPESSGAWYLWTVKLNNNNILQIAYEAHGTKPYIRAKVARTWGAWEKVGKEAVEDTYITSSIALFPSVGCCGDSFTAGYLYNKTDSQWYDPDYAPNGEYPKIGYPAVMGRLYGVDVTAYAKGGLTSTAYRTNAKGLPALLADTAKDLYIIALGLNDKTQNVPMGVEADIDTEPETPTYLGNMGAIIRAIKSHAPNSRIVLCKSMWVYNAGSSSANSYYNYISEGVELLSSHLGIPYIETLRDAYFCSDAYVNGLKGLHPTAPLYAGIGKRMGELVGKCVIDNPEYFYNFYIE